MTTIVGIRSSKMVVLGSDTRITHGRHYHDDYKKIVEIDEKIFVGVSGDSRFITLLNQFVSELRRIIELRASTSHKDPLLLDGQRSLSSDPDYSESLDLLISKIAKGVRANGNDYTLWDQMCKNFINTFMDVFTTWLDKGKGDRGTMEDDYYEMLFAMPDGLYMLTSESTIVSGYMLSVGSGANYAYGYLTHALGVEEPEMIPDNIDNHFAAGGIGDFLGRLIRSVSLWDNGTSPSLWTVTVPYE